MNRFSLVLGVFLAVYLMAQFHSGEIDSEMVFDAAFMEKEMRAVNEGAENDILEKVIDAEELEDDTVVGMLISYSDETMEAEVKSVFAELQKDDFARVVLVAVNDSRIGETDIVLPADSELELLESSYISTSNWAFKDAEGLALLEVRAHQFWPESEVMKILIKEGSGANEINELVHYLGQIEGSSLVVGVMEEPEEEVLGELGLVQKFQDQIVINVLESLDVEGLDKINIRSKVVVETLTRYLALKESPGFVVNKDADYFVAVSDDNNEVKSDRQLTILAFGDMMLGRHVRTLMDRYGNDYPFRNIAGADNRFFQNSDVVFANLEGPIHGQGKSGGTAMNFSFNEDVAPLLKSYGFNLLSISNNHAVDQGWEGRDTTIAALDANNLGWCGHPSEADPGSVYYGEVGDKEYAFLCFHDVTFRLDDQAALGLVREVREKVDYLVVSVHWGPEYFHAPDWSTEVEPGRAFVDAGADIVIGHHPHVVQSFEIYNGRPIFYSLGNFIFDQYWAKKVQEQLGIGVVLDDAYSDEQFKAKIYLFPMKSENSQPRLMSSEERAEWIERFIGYGEYNEEMKRQIRDGVIEVGY